MRYRRRRHRQTQFNAAAVSHIEGLEPRRLLTVASELVADIGAGFEADSNPRHFSAGDDVIWFSAESVTTGRELWKTNGTSAGTQLVRDLMPGPEGSSVDEITPVGVSVFFSAKSWDAASNSGVTVRQLFRSDGTMEGTHAVLWDDGTPVVDPEGLAAAGDRGLTFLAKRTPGDRFSAWSLSFAANSVPTTVPGGQTPYGGRIQFEGYSTALATFHIGSSNRIVTVRADQTAAADLGDWYSAATFRSVGNHFVFQGRHDRFDDWAWWSSDGTATGTGILPIPDRTLPNSFSELPGGDLLFAVQNSDRSREIWSTDGTAAGTVRLFGIPGAGPYNPGSGDRSLIGLEGGRIAFLADGEVWQTDGTATGTTRLTTFPEIQPVAELYALKRNFTFIASDYRQSDKRPRWWRVSTENAELTDLGLATERPGPFDDLVADSRGMGFVFESEELWGGDGTTAPTLLLEIDRANSGSQPRDFTSGDDSLFFSADSGVYELSNNGEVSRQPILSAGARVIPTSGDVTWAISAGRIYMRADDASSWRELTQNAASAHVSSPQFAAVVGRQLYYWTRVTNQWELWVTDGTGAGTGALRDSGGSRVHASELTALDQRRLLLTRYEANSSMTLWTVDRSSFQIRRLATEEPLRGAGNSYNPGSAQLRTIGNRAIFVSAHSELWSSDGTEAGTQKLFTATTGSLQVIAASGKAVFVVSRSASGNTVWRTDGTVAGTQLVNAPSTWNYRDAIAVDSTLFVVEGGSLWSIRDDAEQPEKLRDLLLNVGPLDVPRNVAWSSSYGQLIFLTHDRELGWSFWISDGSQSGTQPLLTAAGMTPTVPATAATNDLDVHVATTADLATLRGNLYYAGIWEQWNTEPSRLTSDDLKGVPANLQVTVDDTTWLNWREVFGTDVYEIEVTDLQDPDADVQIHRTDGAAWQIPSALSGEALQIRIRGVGNDGSPGAWNNDPLRFTLSATPIVLSSPETSTDPVQAFAWAAPPATTGVEIWLSDLDQGQRIDVSSASWTDSELRLPPLPASRYALWLRSRSAAGFSPWNDVTTFSILEEAPAFIDVSVDDSRLLSLNWGAVPGATDYEIVVRSAVTNDPVLQKTQIGSRTNWIFSESLPGGRYFAEVRARRPGRGHSEWKQSADFLVRQAPQMQLALPAIRWNTVEEATEYELEIRNLRTGQRERLLITDQTSITLNPEPAPALYEYRIRSKYADGANSPWHTVRQETFHEPVTIVTSGLATVDATPVIRWQPSADAISYDLEIYSRDTGQRQYRALGLVETSHRVSPPLPLGLYQVWVRSHHPNGGRSYWGEGTSLSIGPAPKLSTTDSLLQWSADAGATRYELSLYEFNTATGRYRPYSTHFVFGTEYQLPDNMNGRFRAWVRAIRDEAGERYSSYWSEPVDVML